MEKICLNCGKETEEKNMYCLSCGSSSLALRTETAPAPVLNLPPVVHFAEQQQPAFLQPQETQRTVMVGQPTQVPLAPQQYQGQVQQPQSYATPYFGQQVAQQQYGASVVYAPEPVVKKTFSIMCLIALLLPIVAWPIMWNIKISSGVCNIIFIVIMAFCGMVSSAFNSRSSTGKWMAVLGSLLSLFSLFVILAATIIVNR